MNAALSRRFGADERTAARRWDDRGALALAVAFGILSSLSRPFVSNQNTYLVHAARMSGQFDELATDWFANTTDPTPVFSVVSALVIRALGPFGLVAANALLGACFLHALVLAAEGMRAPTVTRPPRALLAALLCLVWFTMPRLRAVVFDGVAGQFVHGNFFQPASFGVLLIAAFAAFGAARFTKGVALAAAAVWFHPTYAFSFGVLVVAVLTTSPESIKRRTTQAALAAASILPVLILAWIRFMPASAEHLAAAQSVLVEWRLPHHAVPSRWFDGSVVLRMLLVVVALFACHRTARTRISIVAAFVVALTLVAHAFPEARSLRLTFPWRVSSWLTPLSFAVLLHACLSLLHFRSPKYVTWGAVALAGWALVRGASDGLARLAEPASPGLELAGALRSRFSSGQSGTVLVPTEWQDVRLNAKLPVFVDFKSHPYRDVETLEWRERVVAARGFYAAPPAERCSRLDNVLKLDPSIEWILSPPGFAFDCSATPRVFPSPLGSIHQVVAVAASGQTL